MTWWWLYRLEIRQNAFLWSTIPQKPLLTMMNCFCGMADRWKAFSLISSRDNCQRSWPSQISDMPRVVFELVQDLSSGFIEWSDWTKEMTTSVFVHCCVFLSLFIYVFPFLTLQLKLLQEHYIERNALLYLLFFTQDIKIA